VADGSNVVDEAQAFHRKELGIRLRVDVECREGEDAGLLPACNVGLDLGRPHHLGPVRRNRPVLANGDVIVRAPNLVLGAVAAKEGNVSI